jgi:Cytochrome c3
MRASIRLRKFLHRSLTVAALIGTGTFRALRPGRCRLESRHGKLKARATVALVFAAAALAQPNPQASCGGCHAAQVRTQPKTAMGIGIELPADQAALIAHPKLAFERDGYRYSIERQGDRSVYTVSDAAHTLSLPIRYAFGTHMQTYVFEHEGKVYESMVSYFPRLEGLGVTLGDERRHPRTIVEAMGRETPNSEITACFECHGTGGVREGRLTLDSLRPGLDCEHCHTGAAAHAQSIATGGSAPPPRSLGKLDAEDVSQFCGKCHRTWEEIVMARQFGVANARFQPYRLANSKCFLGNDRRIACTACHDPHADPPASEAAYDAKCGACHGVDRNPCPVAQANCTTCHMPKIRRTDTPAVFTDHQIRIVKPGEYPN